MQLPRLSTGAMVGAAIGIAAAFFVQVKSELDPENKPLSYASQALDYAWITLLFPGFVPVPSVLKPVVMGAAVPQAVTFIHEQTLKVMETADRMAEEAQLVEETQ